MFHLALFWHHQGKGNASRSLLEPVGAGWSWLLSCADSQQSCDEALSEIPDLWYPFSLLDNLSKRTLQRPLLGYRDIAWYFSIAQPHEEKKPVFQTILQ